MSARPPDDDRARIADLIQQLTSRQTTGAASEALYLRRFFALDVLPPQPTTRVYQKFSQHVEDDTQWPIDTSADDYLASLKGAILNPRGGIYLAEPGIEGSWTIYFSAPVPYHSRGRHPGDRIVVLFNAERFFWITGFQAEAGHAYVGRRSGFWVHHDR